MQETSSCHKEVEHREAPFSPHSSWVSSFIFTIHCLSWGADDNWYDNFQFVSLIHHLLPLIPIFCPLSIRSETIHEWRIQTFVSDSTCRSQDQEQKQNILPVCLRLSPWFFLSIWSLYFLLSSWQQMVPLQRWKSDRSQKLWLWNYPRRCLHPLLRWKHSIIQIVNNIESDPNLLSYEEKSLSWKNYTEWHKVSFV
jgi:hypothetical protein